MDTRLAKMWVEILFRPILVLTISFLPLSMISQSIGYFTGIFDYRYEEVVPIINQGKHYNTDIYQGLVLDYPITNNFSIGLALAKYWGWTNFGTDDNLRSIGDGSAYVKLNRFGIQGEWHIYRYKTYLKISPYVRIDYEKNDVQISGLTNTVNYLPDPQNNYEGSIYVETYEGGQILPSLGFRVSLRPFWKVWIFGDLFYSIGHRTHQRLYFDYSYKDVPQQRAEWHSNGSGFVKTIGIGIQLWDSQN